MNQELKEQAHKEFDDFFSELLSVDNDGFQKTYQKLHLMPMIYKFLDSLIDKTVQVTEERIIGIIENIHTKHYIPEYFNPIENREHFGYRKAQMDIKNSLITNKSDINK